LFFKNYENGWPIRDICRVYLSNEQTRQRLDLEEEATWEAMQEEGDDKAEDDDQQEDDEEEEDEDEDEEGVEQDEGNAMEQEDGAQGNEDEDEDEQDAALPEVRLSSFLSTQPLFDDDAQGQETQNFPGARRG
jgi:hypothetical protein